MKNKETIFKIFLVIYAGLLIFHATKMDWGLISFIGLASGLVLAYFAHAKKGFLTLLLLAVHMSIEWSHHFEFGLTYSAGELALHGIHAIFDGVFLVAEWKHHRKGALKAVLAGALIGVLSLMILGGHGHEDEVHTDESSEEHSEEAGFPFESLVIGGILGCVATHLLEKKNTKFGSA
ncbi:MAG: hypothetical protein QG654_267 [Patescibacteria group bacterium]|nr:hypothetical protein [Patescibacteria group bacterium]